MPKNTKDVYGASGTTSLLSFKPESLTLVTDEASPLYDVRVHLPLDEAMVRNIMHHGVIEPICVVKNTETGLVEVVIGRQRVKCCAEANRRLGAEGKKPWTVPAYVRRNETDSALAGFMVSENEIRKADSPLGRAAKMQHLMRHGDDESRVAVIFGCSVATVRSTLALLDMPKASRDAVDAGKVTLTQAKQLAKLSPDEQREKVAELATAAEGAAPRERAAKQRAVMGAAVPKMRTRKEVLARMQDLPPFAPERDTLNWVLGVA